MKKRALGVACMRLLGGNLSEKWRMLDDDTQTATSIEPWPEQTETPVRKYNRKQTCPQTAHKQTTYSLRTNTLVKG